MKDFPSETSRVLWQMFKQTGNIGYMSLFMAIENADKTKILEDEREL